MAFQVGFVLGLVLVLEVIADAENDLLLVLVELDHLEGQFLAIVKALARIFDLVDGQLRHRYKAVHVLFERNDDAALQQA